MALVFAFMLKDDLSVKTVKVVAFVFIRKVSKSHAWSESHNK